MQIDNNGHIGN